MSAALSGVSNSPSNAFSLLKANKLRFIEILTGSKTKKIVNYISNGSASALSLLTFLSGNFHLFNSFQEKLERFSESLSKIAYGIVHCVGAIDLWQKKNIFPFIGYALAVPSALFSSGYNLVLSTGFASGLINFIIVVDQREIVDNKGNPILDKNGNVQVIGGDFKDRGWSNSFTTSLKETLKIIRELINKPSQIKNTSHAVFISSSLQMIGSLIGLGGLKSIGASLRNAGTVGVQAGMLLQKDIKNKNKINLKSPFVQAGFMWIGAAIIDLLKRISFISEKITNLTHLSLFFDRFASIRFTQGILNIKKD